MVGKQKVEVQRVRDGGWTFIQYKVPCGRVECTRCPHGPYWYGYQWRMGRVREVYIGKSLSIMGGDAKAWLTKKLGRMRRREDAAEMEGREDES